MTVPQFLFQTLEDYDIGINSHTDTQDDTSDTRKSELNSGNQADAVHDDNDIDGECNIRNQAWKPVNNDHKNKDDCETDSPGDHRIL